MGTHPIFESDFDCLTEKTLNTVKMAMSGVTVNDACIKMWEQMKTGKIKACMFKLSDNFKEIVVDEGSVIEKNAPDAWKRFTSSLPETECRYAIYDVEMSIDLGPGIPAGVRTKLTFISWAPEKSKIRSRMVSASSKDALKRKFDGVQVEWQLTAADELEASDRISDLAVLPDIKTSGGGILLFEGIKA